MTVEVSLIIAAVSLIFGIYQGVSNMKRGDRTDIKSEAAQLATVIIKLESMGHDISEIKEDLRDIKNDVKDHSIEITKMQQQVKALEKNVFKASGSRAVKRNEGGEDNE